MTLLKCEILTFKNEAWLFFGVFQYFIFYHFELVTLHVNQDTIFHFYHFKTVEVKLIFQIIKKALDFFLYFMI